MGKWSKFIGAALGVAFLGPLGGILGYFIGKNFDEMYSGKFEDFDEEDYVNANQGNLLFTNILGFMAAVVKADKVVRKSEIETVMSFLKKMYDLDPEDTIMARKMFNEMLNTRLDIRELCVSFNKYANKAMKLTLINMLFQISYADGNLHPAEEKTINLIANYLGISAYEVRSIKAGCGYNENAGSPYSSREELRKAYDILGVSEKDSADKIKKAYYELVKQYHPDQFQAIDHTAERIASDRMCVINQAYQTIKKA